MMKHYSNGHMTYNDYFMMYLAKWKRVAVILLVIWIVVTYLVISPLRCNGNTDESLEFQDRLRRVSSQLETLRQQHGNLIAQIRKSSGLNGNLKDIDTGTLYLDTGHGPTEEYENLRRRIHSNTKELWYYINHELTKVIREDNKIEKLQNIIDQISERKRSLLSDQDKLPELDGYHEWRQTEAANVSDLIQRRLHYLQNPPDCREARKLICNLNKGCGFGCQVHHIAYCLIFAYATERTLILNSKGWRYNTKGWDYVFHPISNSCTSAYGDKVLQWPVSYDAKVISLPFIDSISQKPKFLPLAIPKDLAHRIVRFNGDPASWWVGQMLKYILKPRTELQKAINETIAKMNFKTPIVGVHIRRTDKVGTEAAFHHIHEYMAHVKEYYDQLELTRTVDVRRVYLATDDANVLDDARKKYPQYEFLGDPSIAKTAATHRRYTPLSLTGLLVDLHMLAMCDYIVCTFSSQVGRVAYEMMQTNRVDASNSFFSLDDIYYFGGQNAHDRVAVMPHTGGNNQDISLQVGDLIGIAGNHWNGYGRGTNKRSNMACEKLNLTEAVQSEANHFICDDNGELKCLAGWQGDLCDVPICKKGCDPLQGYCKSPGECRCKIGFYGERCNKCITLPGCQHGYCNQSFECICHKGWDGLFCSEPICRADCHATRGYCEAPNECRCRIGWSGPTCRSCQPLPGCQHGYCDKPLECKCHPGYTGLLCQTPICAPGCNNEHGYCRRPGECRCKVGWKGRECGQCHPYPGCVHGTCNRPWECNCKSGWGGMLCDEALDYCEKNSDVCKNGGTCQSLEAGDGHFRCHCAEGTTGKHCEKIASNMTTPAVESSTEAAGSDDSTSTNKNPVSTAENVIPISESGATTSENGVSSEDVTGNSDDNETTTPETVRSTADHISNQIDKLKYNLYNLFN